MTGKLHFLLIGLAAALCVPVAGATTLTLGGGPAVFSFGGLGSGATENPFTFSGPATVTVVDGGVDGDRFSVLDGALLLGSTSAPGDDGTFCADYAACLADAKFSRRVFTLGAGAHSLSISVVQSATGFSSGSGFVNADAVSAALTPEPQSVLLLGTGLVGLAGAVKRRKA